jgi:hypothetical protein
MFFVDAFSSREPVATSLEKTCPAVRQTLRPIQHREIETVAHPSLDEDRSPRQPTPEIQERSSGPHSLPWRSV